MPRKRPSEITVRAYNVGFGDCFLVTFHYPDRDRHVLIDFGSTGKPKDAERDHMMKVARSIESECGGKLDAVVATHRHRDHISGFSTRKNKKGTGDVIRALEPEVVIQPWTEDPDAQPDATSPTRISHGTRSFVGALHNMQAVAKSVLDEAGAMCELHELLHAGEALPPGKAKPAVTRTSARRLAFMGENNVKNLSAVKNLMAMGKRRLYVHYGSEHGLEELLPGVKVRVLGPPTLEQSETIASQRHQDQSEFWHLQARAGKLVTEQKKILFPDAEILEGEARPRASRWLVERMRHLRGEQLLEIVTILDQALNNTSVILLFEVGKEKLLFPGDAQIENWLYALEGPDKTKNRRRLKKVTFYKVGHHGSLNATPKSLWGLFAHRSDSAADARRLRSVVSTKSGKHGSPQRRTEVPRKTLVEALAKDSDFASTMTKLDNPKWEQVDKLFLKTVLEP